MLETVASPALWAAFLAGVIVLLALDLGVFHRHSHTVSMREAGTWSVVWVTLALVFGGWVHHAFGAEKALEFGTGYLIEKALSVDNIFVFVVLFRAFRIAPEHQHRVLFWGVFGALALRAVFIIGGAALLAHAHWVVYVFGALLIASAVKLLRHGDEGDPAQNVFVRLTKRFLPVTESRGEHFLVRENGRLAATPLLLALVAIEASDVMFAVDSIPAVFAVTQDPFVVFTSNVFAILGLRSLYFLLAGVIDRFELLKPALALVLLFVGAKMLLAGVIQIPVLLSLGIILAILVGAVLLSLLRARQATPSQSRA